MARVWESVMQRAFVRAAGDASSVHDELVEKYALADPAHVVLTDDAKKLIAFNGYYSLDAAPGTAPGAFFAVDTNLLIKDGTSQPITDVTLIVSLDGTTSFKAAFTGTFIDGRVIQSDADAPFAVDLVLTRLVDDSPATASCSGDITLTKAKPTRVTGRTYNNPIPCSVFAGTYYYAPSGVPVRVMEIGTDYQLRYDYGTGNGTLQPVPTYSFNMNMYYFSFGPKAQTTQLVMGTSGAQGLACNNIYPGPSGSVSRSLMTIPTPTTGNAKAKDLSAFSGFYLLPSLGAGAFLTIQGQYQFVGPEIVDYQVQIALSMDGKSSRAFTFDETMTFEDERLTIPNVADVKFARHYDAERGTLTSVEGWIAPYDRVRGENYLNPVPVTAFGGATMRDKTGDSLVVNGDGIVSYDGNDIVAGVYVPLMYILAGSTLQGQEWLLSLGTAGIHGTACIVTSVPAAPAGVMSIVTAIPS